MDSPPPALRPATAQRLLALRKAIGYPSAAELARAAGVHAKVYQQVEAGRKNLNQHDAKLLAGKLDTTASFILTGEHTMQGGIPVVGLIGPLSRILRAAGPLETIVAPSDTVGVELAAVRIGLSASLGLSYRPGDTLIYDEHAISEPIDPGISGHEAIVELRNGERVLAYVTIALTRRATLTRHDGATDFEVALTGAAPVLWVKRAPIRA